VKHYHDSTGKKRTLREMMLVEPDWVVARFHAMEEDMQTLREILDATPITQAEPEPLTPDEIRAVRKMLEAR
jgi:hypothetical protein